MNYKNQGFLQSCVSFDSSIIQVCNCGLVMPFTIGRRRFGTLLSKVVIIISIIDVRTQLCSLEKEMQELESDVE
jgi:hypothetical protein